MTEEERKEKFLEEYRAICEKYGMSIEAYATGDLALIDGLTYDPKSYLDYHIKLLKES